MEAKPMPGLVTCDDLASATLIALIVLLVLACVFPGPLRLRASAVAGFWAGPDGALARIKAAGERALAVQTAAGEQAGRMVGFRGVRLADARAGTLELGGRRIAWDDGTAWTRQGL